MQGLKSLCENQGALARMVQKTADLSTALPRISCGVWWR
jgi:hypothetical protein